LQAITVLLETSKNSGKPHLVLVPAGWLSQWENDFKTFVKPDHLDSVLVYRTPGMKTNTNKTVDEEILGRMKVVITTYEGFIVEQENFLRWARAVAKVHLRRAEKDDAAEKMGSPSAVQADRKPKAKSVLPRRGPWPLLNVSWEIVALDEAHYLCDPSQPSFRYFTQLEPNFTIAITAARFVDQYRDLGALCKLINFDVLADEKRFEKVRFPPF
jgi:SNF2 family DNA or RNA helicase